MFKNFDFTYKDNMIKWLIRYHSINICTVFFVSKCSYFFGFYVFGLLFFTFFGNCYPFTTITTTTLVLDLLLAPLPHPPQNLIQLSQKTFKLAHRHTDRWT